MGGLLHLVLYIMEGPVSAAVPLSPLVAVPNVQPSELWPCDCLEKGH